MSKKRDVEFCKKIFHFFYDVLLKRNYLRSVSLCKSVSQLTSLWFCVAFGSFDVLTFNDDETLAPSFFNIDDETFNVVAGNLLVLFSLRKTLSSSSLDALLLFDVGAFNGEAFSTTFNFKFWVVSSSWKNKCRKKERLNSTFWNVNSFSWWFLSFWDDYIFSCIYFISI